MKRLFFIALLLGGLLGNACRRPAKPAAHLQIAAAADLQFTLPEVIAAFRVAHPENQVEFTTGASGSLVTQIESGAPFDLFLSADTKLVERLLKGGQGLAGTDFGYARGRVVLWVAKAGGLDPARDGLRLLVRPEVRKIALANPAHAPYGAAAMRALEAAGLQAELEPKLVRGENVAQAAQFAEAGTVEAALISESLALSPKMAAAGRHAPVPGPLLPQTGVLLSRTTERPLGEAFRAYLLSPAGQEILRRHGFQPPVR